MDTLYVYIMGSVSGVGKTTICEGLLSQLLVNAYQPEQLAYIKPMTQCTEQQPVSRFCERQHIACHANGSLVFRQSFTQEFIAGQTKSSDELKAELLNEILEFGKSKEFVLVDALGGVATGSVIGIANTDLARSLGAPVLFIGKAGIGSAIDDTILSISFLQQQGIQDIALLYNKIPPAELNRFSHYVRKRLAELLPDFPILDFIPEYPTVDHFDKYESAGNLCRWCIAHMPAQ